MEKMVASNRDIVKAGDGGELIAKDGSDSLLAIIKENKSESLRSLNEIYKRVEHSNVEIKDVQLLFDSRGRFVVNDPEKIIPASEGGNVRITLGRIKQLVNFIEKLN
jgi:hypothetical protein